MLRDLGEDLIGWWLSPGQCIAHMLDSSKGGDENHTGSCLGWNVKCFLQAHVFEHVVPNW